MGPLDHLRTAADDVLWGQVLGNPPGSPAHQAAKALLKSRQVERQVKSAVEQANAARQQAAAAQAQPDAADSMTQVTRRLVAATWALVVATLIAAALLGWITWKVGTGAIRLG